MPCRRCTSPLTRAQGDRIVILDAYGTVHPDAFVAAFDMADCVNFHIYVQEDTAHRAEQLSTRLGRPVTDWIIVFNLAGMTLRHVYGPLMTFVTDTLKIDEAHYPETLACAAIVCAPKVFTVIFAMLKPFVDPATLAKTKVLGADWMAAMAEWVPDALVPRDWGGSGQPWDKPVCCCAV